MVTGNEEEAFKGVDVALLVGAFPRKAGMERNDLLQKNAAIFRQTGQALARYASRNVKVSNQHGGCVAGAACIWSRQAWIKAVANVFLIGGSVVGVKVLVVGNPANTNALIALKCATGLPPENFTALTRLDQNRAKAQIARKLHTSASNVHTVVIWGNLNVTYLCIPLMESQVLITTTHTGNHSSTQFPDVAHGWVDAEGKKIPIRKALSDDQWLLKEFIPCVQQRGAAVIKVRRLKGEKN